MDPDQTLKEIRALLARADELDGTDTHELTTLMQALDEWLTNGGFLPAEWRNAQTPRLR